MNGISHLSGSLLSILKAAKTSHLAAYLDPGSGSFLLQLLVAGILGGLFAVRAFWGRLRGKITRKNDADQDEPDQDEPDSE